MQQGLGKHIGFLAMNQGTGLRHVVDVSGRANHRVHQPRIGIHADVALHPEMPLVPFLGLVHLGVALPVLVLGGTGSCNQRGVYHRAFPEHQAFVGECGVDRGQDLFGQLVLFQQVAKAQDADPVWDAFDTGV